MTNSNRLAKVKQEKLNDKIILANLGSSKQKLKGLNKHNQPQMKKSIEIKSEANHEQKLSERSKENRPPQSAFSVGKKRKTSSEFILQRAPNLKNDNAVTSTPNDKIQGLSGKVPELHHKQANFASKFFLSTENPDIFDSTNSDDDSLSPCKNVKQVKKAAATAAATTAITELEALVDQGKSKGLETTERGNSGLMRRQEKPENYPIFGNPLIESFRGEELSEIVSMDLLNSNSAEFLKVSKSNFEDWALEGLQICSNYEKIIKDLIVARLKFASQVDNLKRVIDSYGLALQEKKQKLETKSTNLQHSGKKLVEEAKSF